MLTPAVRALTIGVVGDAGPCEASMPDDRLYLAVGSDVGAAGPTKFVAASVSRSGTTGLRGLLASSSGRVGLDIEALARIALNATVSDRWLSGAERRAIGNSTDPLLETACCWVLKEAYGKALGVGLALPLDRLAFAAHDGVIVLTGGAGPAPRSRWSFALYRYRDTIIATAWDSAGQPTPFAPAGRKPPTLPSDR